MKILAGNAIAIYNGTVDASAFETVARAALNLNLSAATAVGIDISYQEV